MLSVFYAEFDNAYGPQIVHQFPSNVLPKEQFDAVKNYVITAPSLSERTLSVKAFDRIVMSFPVYIFGARYGRNALIFSVGFVLGHKISTRERRELKQVIRKLGTFFKRMELENAALSGSSTKEWVARMLRDIFEKLRRSGQSCILEYEGNKIGLYRGGSRRADTGSGVGHRTPAQVGKKSIDAHTGVTGTGGSFGGTSSSSSSSSIRGFKRLSIAKLAETRGIALTSSSDVVAQKPIGSDTFARRRGSAAATTVCVERHHRIGGSRRGLDRKVPIVHNYDVPVLLSSAYRRAVSRAGQKDVAASGIDLTIQLILPYIDGVRYVRAISEDANADDAFVRKALRSMSHYNLVGFVDIFQYSNMYVATDRIRVLVTSAKLREECVRCCYPETPGNDTAVASTAAMASANRIDLVTKSRRRGHFQRIFKALCGFGCGTRVVDLIRRRPNLAKGSFDVRRFIAFGVLHGFLQRVHEYPIAPEELRKSCIEEANRIQDTIKASVVSLFDGKHPIDSICVSFGVSKSYVIALTQALGGACSVYRKPRKRKQ